MHCFTYYLRNIVCSIRCILCTIPFQTLPDSLCNHFNIAFPNTSRLMQKTGFCEALVLHVIEELFWSTRCVCLSLKRGIHEKREGKKLHTALYILSLNSVCVRLQTNHSATLLISLSQLTTRKTICLRLPARARLASLLPAVVAFGLLFILFIIR